MKNKEKTKICNKCKMEQSEQAFSKDANKKDGVSVVCKVCQGKYQREYYKKNEAEIVKLKKEWHIKNKERIHKKQKIYIIENKKQILENSRKYYWENKDELNKHNREYWIKNKERLLHNKKKYYKENKERIINYGKQYYKKNRKKILEREKIYCKKNKERLTEYRKQYYIKNKERLKKIIKEYSKTDKGKLSLKKAKDKRYRNLGFIPLIENPFPNELQVDFHHINNIFVMPLPRIIHRRYAGYKVKEHRERCNEELKDIFYMNIEEIFLQG